MFTTKGKISCCLTTPRSIGTLVFPITDCPSEINLEHFLHIWLIQNYL